MFFIVKFKLNFQFWYVLVHSKHIFPKKKVISDIKLVDEYPNGYQTTFLPTHEVCAGHYELWWVVRTRWGQKKQFVNLNLKIQKNKKFNEIIYLFI